MFAGECLLSIDMHTSMQCMFSFDWKHQGFCLVSVTTRSDV